MGIPVREMLMRMDSYELTEWKAYERAIGPLGPQYTDDMLASIHEQLQLIARLIGEQFRENPAPQPRRVPRPDDIFREQPEEGPEEESDGFAQLDRFFDES